MRKDMSKVIVERPRLGRSRAGLRPGRTRVVTDDDGEPLRAVRGGRAPKRDKAEKTKSLNETLNPLRRYLASNVGRPWNKVYAEISEHLKPTSTVQQHVRDHLEDFVAVKTRMKAGSVTMTPRYGGERTLADTHCRFYVHPRTGLLRENPHYSGWNARLRKAKAAADAERCARMRIIDDKTQLHLFDGAWWEVKLAKKRSEGPNVDVVRRAKLSTMPGNQLYARDGVYAVDKRQLSKAEMKRLKLR